MEKFDASIFLFDAACAADYLIETAILQTEETGTYDIDNAIATVRRAGEAHGYSIRDVSNAIKIRVNLQRDEEEAARTREKVCSKIGYTLDHCVAA